MSANRRRWIHVFPPDARGMARQSHHTMVYGNERIQQYAVEEKEPERVELSIPVSSRPSSVAGFKNIKSPVRAQSSVGASPKIGMGKTQETDTVVLRDQSESKRGFVWAWGPTGEEKWNPDLEIGTDWKSLTRPALLPTATDYFPDSRTLKDDYLLGDHPVLLDDCVKELWSDAPSGDFRIDIFEEMVAQRLQKGFQIIVLSKDFLSSAVGSVCRDPPNEKECYLSINRIYHRISLRGDEINVKKFLPRHKYTLTPTDYQYQFQVPDSRIYEFSKTRFEHEALSKFNWSAFDNFIANMGEGGEVEFSRDALKCWHSRFLLVPVSHPATIAVRNSEADAFCDIYSSEGDAINLEPRKLEEGFLKFMEVLNKIRRPQHKKKQSEKTQDDSDGGNPESGNQFVFVP